MSKKKVPDLKQVYIPASNPSGLTSKPRGGKREDLGGIYFRSAWEANWARYLDWQRTYGDVFHWSYEPETFEFKGIKRGTRFYTPDFRVHSATAHTERVEYHEVKGYMDATSRTKLKRMAKYYPDVKVVVIDRVRYMAVAKKLAHIIPNWEHGNAAPIQNNAIQKAK